jgi:hypothetical protein
LNRRSSLRRAAPLGALALGLIALGGCGGGSGSTSSTTAAQAPARTATSESSPSGGQSGGSSGGAETSANRSAKESASSNGSGASESSSNQPSKQTPEASIEGYGSAAQGATKSQIANTALAFFRAMAAHDYAKLCAGILASNRASLQSFLKAEHKEAGGCPAALSTLLVHPGPEASKAAHGTVTGVRIKGDTAFVLFRPKGGVPSYFVLKREGGAWKAISLAPGTPLNPTAGAP